LSARTDDERDDDRRASSRCVEAMGDDDDEDDDAGDDERARSRDLELDIILILDAVVLDVVVLGGGVRPGVGESDGESVEDERGDRRGGEMRQSRGRNVATDR